MAEMQRELDALDCQIIDLLMQDGRMPAAEIARRCQETGSLNVTERMARYRIERLVKTGVIRISAIPNPHAVGYDIVADVLVEVEPGLIDRVARTLAQHEEVSYVATSIGENDVSVQIVAHTNQEVYAFATEVIGKLPGVRKTTTSIVPLTLKDVYQWRIPRKLCGARMKGNE